MKQRTIWTVAVLWFAAIAAGLYWWWRPEPIPPSARPAPAAPVAVTSAAPASSSAAVAHAQESASTPPSPPGPASAGSASVSIADALVAAFGRQAVLQFINVDAFAQRVAATVDNLPRAHAPARLWPVHPTPGRFGTLTTGDATVIGADNAKRYATTVGWIESLDVAQVAALYRQLYPQLQRAYEDLGYPGRSFHARLLAVIDHLLETPVADEPIAVKLPDIKGPIQPVRPWVMVEFADPDVEARSAGQKLLLRTGALNAQRLKLKLRALRAAVASGVTPR
jgi:Protein of unknown function (DUF3014)